MKIVAISDLHGYLPADLPTFDLLLIAGDICPTENHSYSYQREWLKNDFVNWINSLPFNNACSKVVFTPGNHDMFFERERPDSIKYISEIAYPCNGRFVYLRNQEYKFEYIEQDEIKSVSIFGTPWCHRFGNWAFMNDDHFLKAKFDEIPDNIDILLTHDAPYKCSDICYNSFDPHNIGSEPLREAILRAQPKFCFHGHLHSSNHEPMFLGKTRVMNVSLLGESYTVDYEPRILDSSVLDCEVEYKIDEEYVFPNRYGELIKLVKVTPTLYELKGDLKYCGVVLNLDNSIYSIDPSGGPFLAVGAKWFDFTIKAINDFNNKILIEIEKIK